jgi:hypothetical protein
MGTLLSYLDVEQRDPLDRPLRAIGTIVQGVLGGLNRELARFSSDKGRPSIILQRPLLPLLLQMSILSGRRGR